MISDAAIQQGDCHERCLTGPRQNGAIRTKCCHPWGWGGTRKKSLCRCRGVPWEADIWQKQAWCAFTAIASRRIHAVPSHSRGCGEKTSRCRHCAHVSNVGFTRETFFSNGLGGWQNRHVHATVCTVAVCEHSDEASVRRSAHTPQPGTRRLWL